MLGFEFVFPGTFDVCGCMCGNTDTATATRLFWAQEQAQKCLQAEKPHDSFLILPRQSIPRIHGFKRDGWGCQCRQHTSEGWKTRAGQSKECTELLRVKYFLLSTSLEGVLAM